MYIDKSIREYLDDLAARKPTPGGGSAAALTASIGTSLMSMVADYTIGNPKYKDVEEKLIGIREKIKKFGIDLRELIDKDVQAYKELSKGIKEYKRVPAKLDEAYKKATDPVFEICKITSECLRLCKPLAEFGNKNLITDTAAAILFLEGAFFSAKFNVYINLKYIKDMNYIEKVHKVLSPLEDEMPKLREDILEKCEEVIVK